MAARTNRKRWGSLAKAPRRESAEDEPYIRLLIAAVKLAKKDAVAAKEPHRQAAKRWLGEIADEFSE